MIIMVLIVGARLAAPFPGRASPAPTFKYVREVDE